MLPEWGVVLDDVCFLLFAAPFGRSLIFLMIFLIFLMIFLMMAHFGFSVSAILAYLSYYSGFLQTVIFSQGTKFFEISDVRDFQTFGSNLFDSKPR